MYQIIRRTCRHLLLANTNYHLPMEGTDRFGAAWQDKSHLPELPPKWTTATNLQGDDSGAIYARLTFLRAPVTLPVSISALARGRNGRWIGTSTDLRCCFQDHEGDKYRLAVLFPGPRRCILLNWQSRNKKTVFATEHTHTDTHLKSRYRHIYRIRGCVAYNVATSDRLHAADSVLRAWCRKWRSTDVVFHSDDK